MINKIAILPVAAGAAVIGILAATLPLRLFLLITAGALYLGVCMINVRFGLLLTLLLRSSADRFGDQAVSVPLIGSLNVAAFMGLLIIALTIFALLRRTIKITSPLTVIFLLFLSVSAIPTLVSGNIGEGLEKWLKFASMASFFLLVYNFAKEDGRNTIKFIDFTIFSAVIPLATGAVQFVSGTGNTMTEGLNRIDGTFVHPNPFAFYLLIIIAACFIRMRNKGARIIPALIMGVAFLELIFTYTRGAWLGLALMAGIVYAGIKSKSKLKLLVIAVLIALPFANLISARFDGVFSTNMEESSLASRLYIWNSMFGKALDRPVIGHGLGTFEIYAESVTGWKIEAHNEYLRMFFETGALGLAVYLTLLGMTLHHVRLRTGNAGSLINVTVFALFLTFMVISFTDNVIDNLVSQWYLWAFAAMAAAERGRAHESAVSQQVPLPEGRERDLLLQPQ